MKPLLFPFILLFLVLVLNFLKVSFNGSAQILPQLSPQTKPQLNLFQLVNRISKTISFQTVSFEPNSLDSPPDYSEWTKMWEYLEKEFPLVFNKLKHNKIGKISHLLTWHTPSQKLTKPVAFMAHADVVPISPGSKWDHPPFEGYFRGKDKKRIIDKKDFLYGRGSVDDKHALVAQLTVIESLLQQGIVPQRTIFLIFGGDEEIGGAGAQQVVDFLQDTYPGIHLDFVLDEGLVVLLDGAAGVTKPVGFIGVAEKGYANYNISVYFKIPQTKHSSIPSKYSILDAMSSVIKGLHSQPVPSNGIYGTFLHDMLLDLFPHLSFPKKIVMSNLWLFEPIVEKIFSKSPAENALLRSTTSLTILHSGNKANVLPSVASLIVNSRIHPYDDTVKVGNYFLKVAQKAIDSVDSEIFGVNVSMIHGVNSSHISSHNHPTYQVIARSLIDSYPAITAVPGLMLGATDSKHLERICDNVYRFGGLSLTRDSIGLIHGPNERIQIENIQQAFDFYYSVIFAAVHLEDEKISLNQEPQGHDAL